MKQNENYEKIKRFLAISFIHYLDEIRSEGKMCLSNGECKDIDKAFDEMDWDKLARYLEKTMKQTPEQKENRGNSPKIPSNSPKQTLEQEADASALTKYPSFTAENYDLVMAVRRAYSKGFKAGAEWQKKQDELTWEDIMELDNLSWEVEDEVEDEEGFENNDDFYSEVLRRFKKYKEQKNKER